MVIQGANFPSTLMERANLTVSHLRERHLRFQLAVATECMLVSIDVYN